MAARVVLLGTGTPRFEPERSGPATAVVVGDRVLLFDAGPGVARRISDGYHGGIVGMDLSRIDRVYLTHLHSDHVTGLAGLWLASWMFGRAGPFDVYGPRGTDAMVESLQTAYEADVMKRTQSEPHTAGGHEMRGFDIGPGVVFREDRMTVSAFAVQHGEWDAAVHGQFPTLGYRVETAERTIVISGDTGVFPKMAATYGDCDVLVHEVYASAGLVGRPEAWQAYHRAAHTSGAEVGRVAQQVKPEALVLTHQLLWHASAEELLDEVVSEFEGVARLGRDLDVI